MNSPKIIVIGGSAGAIEALRQLVRDLPDGRLLFTGGNVVSTLWDFTTGQPHQSIVGARDVVVSGNFSHDNQQLLTTSLDGTIRLYDSATGQEIRRINIASRPYDAHFSSDDTFIFFLAADGKIYLTYTDPQSTVRAVCSRLLHDFSTDEREQYEIFESRPTCPQFPVAPVATAP
jgi:WD40 repeat protein